MYYIMYIHNTYVQVTVIKIINVQLEKILTIKPSTVNLTHKTILFKVPLLINILYF